MRNKLLIIYGVSILLGLITGLMGSLFQLAILHLDEFIQQVLSFVQTKGGSVLLTSVLISMSFVFIAWLMVRHISPEASGSGVQEIEGALLHERPIFWRRLIPVKFVAGILAISGKLVLGREGPTIQIGGNLGDMFGELLHLSQDRRDTLIMAGAAAGLTTAFNAPLAGVLFVLEELRNEFNFTFTNFKMVAIACVMATITLHYFVGPQADIPMNVFELPSLRSLWLFFLLGIMVGFVGLLFNHSLMLSLKLTDKLNFGLRILYVLMIGAGVGVLAYLQPDYVGGGYHIINRALTLTSSVSILTLILVIRFFTTMLCYSTNVPGGIFAPMLALGALFGTAVSQLLQDLMPDITLHPGMFAVASMGALFAASVRAPITGIVLVVEMTQNYSLILPLMVSCLTSTTVMQLARNQPIYTQLLRRAIRKERLEVGSDLR